MFSSNVTPAEDYKLASDLNAIINFDDITHLDFYDKVVGDWKGDHVPAASIRAATSC